MLAQQFVHSLKVDLLHLSDHPGHRVGFDGILLSPSKLSSATRAREDSHGRDQAYRLGWNVVACGRVGPLLTRSILGYVISTGFTPYTNIQLGGAPLPWSSARILGLLISGAITLVLFGFWEVYSHTPNPLIPMHLFKDVRGFTVLFIISAVSGTVYLTTAILWPSQVA